MTLAVGSIVHISCACSVNIWMTGEVGAVIRLASYFSRAWNFNQEFTAF